MASTPISQADRTAHLEFLRTLDGPGRGRFFTAYKQHAALQTAYGLATDDATEAIHKDWLQSKMENVVQNYAQAECYELMQKISSTLPTELRDMIYGHVWDAKTAAAAFDNVKDVKLRFRPWLKSCSRKPCACFQPRQLPSYVQHEVVGLQMAREVATAYYKAMPPDRLGHNIEHIRAFLTRDHFHLGIVPAEHIRHIRIEITHALYPNLTEIGGSETPCFTSEGLQFYQRSLAKLDLIQRKAGFRFTMVLEDDILFDQTERVLEAMRSSYENFTQAGMHFRVYGYPEFDDVPIRRIDRYYTMHERLWHNFTDVQTTCREDAPLEHPSDDDSPDEASWLNRAADEMERRGYNMKNSPSYEMAMEWWSLITGEPN